MGDNDGMPLLYAFSFRLFVAFLAAKFLARLFGLEGIGYLLGLTLVLLGNIYFFDFLVYRDRFLWRRRQTPCPEAANPPTLPAAPEPPSET